MQLLTEQRGLEVRRVVNGVRLFHYNMGDILLVGNMLSDGTLNGFLPIVYTYKCEYLHRLLPQNSQLLINRPKEILNRC